MSVEHFAYAVLALVRAAGAVAMFDLYRRLRKPSFAPLSAGLALFAAAPILVLLLGVEVTRSAVQVLQVMAITLVVGGILARFTRVVTRTLVVSTALAGAFALVGGRLSPPGGQIGNVLSLMLVAGIAVVFIWKRRQFQDVAGNSPVWGVVICSVAGVMYTSRLVGIPSPDAGAIDLYFQIIVSVALGLYLLNIEYNASHIAQTRSEDRYRTLFDAAGDAIVVIGFDGAIIDANRVMSDWLGYSRDELRAMRIDQVDDQDNAEMVGERMKAIRRDGHMVFESVHRRKDGTLLPVEVSAVLFDLEGQPAILGMFRDLTERKRNEEIIVQMAYYDPLTGLANRSLFNDRLGMAVSHSHRTGDGLALFFIDVDNFKAVNDTLGHQVGDRLLIGIGERMKNLVREGDTVARLGGDEFTLLLPEMSTEEDAARFAWKVLEAFQAPFDLEGEHEIHVTPSIGIALATTGDETPEDMVRNADVAMFRAKDRGRNTFQFYDPEMNAIAIARFEIKNELRRALDAGELEVHYQPQIAIADGRIVGAEALLRWHNPVRGDVSPALFVSLAEESGLIVPIGRWVMSEACKALSGWREEGFDDVSVSVNLSARQFVDDDVCAYTEEMLDLCGVPPERLVLEITESVAMQHSGAVMDSIVRLGDMGIRLAIDDFGTGYSSLDRLKQLPIDTLKIAQVFVDDIGAGKDSPLIVTTIIVLGQSMGLNIIAEGVETQEQLEFLRARRCDEMQGFLFSPAVTNEAFVEMLREQRAG